MINTILSVTLIILILMDLTANILLERTMNKVKTVYRQQNEILRNENELLKTLILDLKEGENNNGN